MATINKSKKTASFALILGVLSFGVLSLGAAPEPPRPAQVGAPVAGAPVAGAPAEFVRLDKGETADLRVYEVRSEYQLGPNPVEVVLPAPLDSKRRYPVVFVLPVNTGRGGQWGAPVEELRKLDAPNRYGAIFVVPSYDIDPWYGDLPTRPATGAFVRQQSYVTEVLLPWVERTFPALAERRGAM